MEIRVSRVSGNKRVETKQRSVKCCPYNNAYRGLHISRIFPFYASSRYVYFCWRGRFSKVHTVKNCKRIE